MATQRPRSRPRPEVAAAPSASHALQAQAAQAAARSPAAQAFNRALRRVEKLQNQIDAMEQACVAHQTALAQQVGPLRAQHTEVVRQLLVRLCEYLDQPPRALTRLQHQTLTLVTTNMAMFLDGRGVPGMAAIHDRYSPHTLAAKEKADQAVLRDHLSQMMSDLTGADLDLTGCDSPDEMMRAAMAQLQALSEQEAAEQAARKARREARRAQKGPTARQQEAQQALKDADTSLRQIYRQLASALHPDREPDEQERQRKNGLMGRANAAYESKDLVALLRLQLEAELVDPDHLERVSEARLRDLTLLLKQQAAELERERQGRELRWYGTLDLLPGSGLTRETLAYRLEDELQTYRADIEEAQQDLAAVQALAGLKRWLNQQEHAARSLKHPPNEPIPFGFF
jgi:hypothetical protein